MPQDLKKFLFKLTLVTPLGFLLILLNYMVDPSGLFKSGGDLERSVAAAMDSGHAAEADLGKLDERYLEMIRLPRLRSSKDIGVLGSSRVMLVSSKIFPGKTLLNNWVLAAILEDYVIICEKYWQKRMLPSTMIIGVDPWIFNRSNDTLESHNAFIQYDAPAQTQTIPLDRYEQLLSISYFQASLKDLWASIVDSFPRQSVGLIDQDLGVFFPDGSTVRPRKFWDISDAVSREKINEGMMDPDFIGGFSEVDQGLGETFIQLILSLKSRGVRVVLYLPPYAPSAYDYFIHSSRFKIIQNTELFVRRVSEVYGFTVAGSYDPHQFSIPDSSFADAMHMRDDKAVDILKEIFLEANNVPNFPHTP